MLKIKENVKLEEYGFTYEEVCEGGFGEECYETKGKLTYNMGDSRRGQSYYLIIEDDRTINVYATKPDGSGTSIELGDVVYELFKNGLIERR